MNTFEPLTERQQDILQAIINTHIMTADAVGSRTVAKKMGYKLSPASIRNVMSDLEELGYVEQPHTSAGRIPTDSGYRVYVNSLMGVHAIELEQKHWIENRYRSRISQIEDLLSLSANLLSILTHYTAVVQLPKEDTERIRHVEMVPLSSTRAVVILVTNIGNIRKQLAILPRDMTDAEIEQLAAFLNKRLHMLSFAAARSALTSFDDSADPLDERLAALALEIFDEALAEDRTRDVYLDGMENIFDQPEFRNVEHLRPVLRVLDEKSRLNKLLEYCVPENDLTDVCICIGSENPLDDVRHCSIVASPYYIGAQMRGTIGIIGPKRMQYSLASSFVTLVAHQLGRFLTRMSGGE